MNRRDDLEARIERLRGAAGDPLNHTDLPNETLDPFAYFTDGVGRWNHADYASVLLERRGTAGPAWVGLRELDELQEKILALKERYLRLWEVIDAEQFSQREVDLDEFERLADQLANDRWVESGIIESIRAVLITLGEIDGPGSNAGGDG